MLDRADQDKANPQTNGARQSRQVGYLPIKENEKSSPLDGRFG